MKNGEKKNCYGLRCVWSPEGNRFAVTKSSGEVFIFQIDKELEIPVLLDIVTAGSVTAWVWDASWDMEGNLLITANSEGIVKLWEESQVLNCLQRDHPLALAISNRQA